VRGGAAAACGGIVAIRQRHEPTECLKIPFFSSSEPTPPPPPPRSPASRTQTIGGYEIGRTLGEGAFAVVKHATHVKSGQQYACKLVQKDRTDKEMFAIEVRILEAAGRHRNIVSLIDRFDAPPDAWALVSTS